MARLKGKHPSRPFNPDVANAFFRAGLIEAWGRGIERILEACRAAQVPEPELRHEPDGLWVEFAFPEAFSGSTTQETTQESRETTQETQQTTQERILALIQADPALTRRALAERIGITPDGIKYHLDRLRLAGRIRHVGPTKAGRWEVLK